MLWLLTIILLPVLIVIAISAYTYRVCFFAPRKRNDNLYCPICDPQYKDANEYILKCTRITDKEAYEQVCIRSFDNLKLYGRYYHFHDHAPVEILFHGYRSLALRDCSGAFLFARKMGFNILIVDQRGHGKSQGNAITFGVLERKDCKSWVNYIAQRFGIDTPIVLFGLSMGAATVLMSSNLDLPKKVAAIIADSPYSSPAHIIRKVCRDRHIPDKLAYPFIRLGAKIFGGFDIESASATKSVAASNIPILLLHGEDDRFVPCQMSNEIWNASASHSQLHTFPGAGHGLCYLTDPLRYEDIFKKFLSAIPALNGYLNLHFDNKTN